MKMNFRKKLINIGFELTSKMYTSINKRNQETWKVGKKELLKMDTDTLGFQLGTFLNENGFDLIPKAERHDCFHVFTNYGTTVENEIGLQYLRLGNGSRSIYTFVAVIAGTLLLPEFYEHYLTSFLIGKKADNFQQIDFKAHLKTPIDDLRSVYFKSFQLYNPVNI